MPSQLDNVFKKNELPLLSICCVTFNHKSFIAKALEGFLQQKTSYNYEIIIHDDASTDGTTEIIKEYENAYPDIIKPIYQKENQFSKGKRVTLIAMSAAKGKYIALCEGDDYWIDPYKIQKQVDFLEAHTDFNLVCGGYQNSKGTNLLGKNISDLPSSRGGNCEDGFEFDFNDMRNLWLTKTLTVMFRRDSCPFQLFPNFKYFRDVHLFYFVLKNSKGYYFKEVFGVYNIHEGGVHSLKDELNHRISSYKCYKELYNYCNDEYLRYMYFIRTLSLLNFNLYHSTSGNSFVNSLSLLKESIKLLKGTSEFKQFLLAFIPLNARKKLKEVL